MFGKRAAVREKTCEAHFFATAAPLSSSVFSCPRKCRRCMWRCAVVGKVCESGAESGEEAERAWCCQHRRRLRDALARGRVRWGDPDAGWVSLQGLAPNANRQQPVPTKHGACVANCQTQRSGSDLSCPGLHIGAWGLGKNKGRLLITSGPPQGYEFMFDLQRCKYYGNQLFLEIPDEGEGGSQ